jgi:hypothetical protein
MHEIRDSGDADRRKGQGLEELRPGAWRWREDALVVVGVVGDPHRDAARGGGPQGLGHYVARLVREADVVERQLERVPGLVEKGGDAPRHLERRLRSRLERVDIDHGGATLTEGVGARDEERRS